MARTASPGRMRTKGTLSWRTSLGKASRSAPSQLPKTKPLPERTMLAAPLHGGAGSADGSEGIPAQLHLRREGVHDVTAPVDCCRVEVAILDCHSERSEESMHS